MTSDTTMRTSKPMLKTLRLFFLIFILVGTVLGGGVYLFYSYEVKGFVNDLLVREEHGVALRKTVVEDGLNGVASDLDFLSTLDSVKMFSDEGISALAGVEKDFYAFSKAKIIYDQIRLFDANGMELVRVNYNGGVPKVVAKGQLQNKGKRYYFMDTMEMRKGEMFVSPMDLNIEKGKVEVPYKPVIRFGTPLYSAENKPVGALIINYNADALLGLLRKTGDVTNGRSMLLNSRGYWLLAPDMIDQWGFMFSDRKNVSFAERYPKLWINIRSSEKGQVVTGNQIFTYTTVYPLNTRFRSSSGSDAAYKPSSNTVLADQYFWKLVSFVPDSASQGYSGGLISKIFFLGAGFFLITGTIAWLLAYFVTRKDLLAVYACEDPHKDLLTGLPSVTGFLDTFDLAFRMAEKYSHHLCLAHIVVDEFLELSDMYGDDAGEELLVEVASRLNECCEKADLIGRTGYARFAVLFGDSENSDTCKLMLGDVEDALDKAFKLGGGAVNVNVSISMLTYPESGRTREELLKFIGISKN